MDVESMRPHSYSKTMTFSESGESTKMCNRKHTQLKNVSLSLNKENTIFCRGVLNTGHTGQDQLVSFLTVHCLATLVNLVN